jgi:predicted nucleic acid-binding protein
VSTIIVSDTSPVQYLVLCDAIGVLPRLFNRVIIPLAVASELQHPNTPAAVRTWIAAPPQWAEIRSPAVKRASLNLGPGEVEAIALALEMRAQAVLLDDQKARAAATRAGLQVLGTLAILERAADKRFLDLNVAFAALRNTTFRIDPRLMEDALVRQKRRLRSSRPQTGST